MAEERTDNVWQQADVAQRFLKGIRAGIPLAQEQLDIMLRLVDAAIPAPQSILDLGCGDGVLGRMLYSVYPEATYTFLDFSEPMLDAARAQLPASNNVTYLNADFGTASWVEQVTDRHPFDVIVSGYAIHHSHDARKRAIYQEVYDLLRLGGIFVHMEHVSSASHFVFERHEDYFIDSLYRQQLREGSQTTRDEVNRTYRKRDDAKANKLQSVEVQCQWLRDIGFTDVDIYLKVFELALFGGRKLA